MTEKEIREIIDSERYRREHEQLKYLYGWPI